jgi:hypothetical protein
MRVFSSLPQPTAATAKASASATWAGDPGKGPRDPGADGRKRLNLSMIAFLSE